MPRIRFDLARRSLICATASTAFAFGTALAQVQVSYPLVEHHVSTLGGTHDRYQQTYHGIPVLGGGYIEHHGGFLGVYQSDYRRSIEVPYPSHTLSPKQVLAKAEALAGVEPKEVSRTAFAQLDGFLPAQPPRLLWFPLTDDPGAIDWVLAYETDVYGEVSQHLYAERLYLTAADGELLHRRTLTCTFHDDHQDPSGRATQTTPRDPKLSTVMSDERGLAQTYYSGRQEVTTERGANDSFQLRQSGRNIETRDYANRSGFAFPGRSLFDDNNFWNARGGEGDSVAVDVYWAAQAYYDLLERFGRTGIDDANGAIRLFVHFGTDVGNATTTGGLVFFGDGNPDSDYALPFVAPDVVGHELTHSLANATARFAFINGNDAIEEGLCDVFGIAVSIAGRGINPDSWRVGSDMSLTGARVRDAGNPNSIDHPDTYLGDFWESTGSRYARSAIVSRWYYLLTVGGQGINDSGTAFNIQAQPYLLGPELAYAAMRDYLTETSGLPDLARETTRVALDRYGRCSTEARAVREAWLAVGLDPQAPDVEQLAFEGAGVACAAPTAFSFTNRSTLADRFRWDFGDGSTSTEISPRHVYLSPGVFDVSLSATGCGGNPISLTEEAYVLVGDSTGVVLCEAVDMTVNETVIASTCRGQVFDPGGQAGPYPSGRSTLVIGAPGATRVELTFSELDILWGSDRFEIYDGPNERSPLLSQDPSVRAGSVVSSSGSYLTLVLTAFEDRSNAGFAADYVLVGGAVPVAGFRDSLLTALVGDSIQLASLARNGEVRYAYGDGKTGTVDVHAFGASGDYTVVQTVENCLQIDTATLRVQVRGSVATQEARQTPFTAYPSPFQQQLSLKLGKTGPVVVKLFGSHGSTIRETRTSQSELVWSLPNLAPGTYWVAVFDAQTNQFLGKQAVLAD